jgi:polysaccharide export outer membrane protein
MLQTAKQIGDHAGNPLPLPRELAKGVLPEYRVEPGDILLVEPANPTSRVRLPGDQVVQPDGTIDLGEYGQLRAVGKTVAEIRIDAESLVTRYERRKATPADADGESTPPFPSLNVRLVEPTSKVYYVTGEVNSPGAYPLIGRETVLDAIIEAGDLTDKANRHKVILSRPTTPCQCRVVLPICYRHVVQLGDTSTNYQIQPGDRIFVASLTFWEELGQCLWPGYGETCPRCAPSPQAPCPHPPSECDGSCAMYVETSQ